MYFWTLHSLPLLFDYSIYNLYAVNFFIVCMWRILYPTLCKNSESWFPEWWKFCKGENFLQMVNVHMARAHRCVLCVSKVHVFFYTYEEKSCSHFSWIEFKHLKINLVSVTKKKVNMWEQRCQRVNALYSRTY